MNRQDDNYKLNTGAKLSLTGLVGGGIIFIGLSLVPHFHQAQLPEQQAEVTATYQSAAKRALEFGILSGLCYQGFFCWANRRTLFGSQPNENVNSVKDKQDTTKHDMK